MLDEFSATVEKLYAAAAGQLPWQEALVALENLTGSAGAVIDLVPKSAGMAPRTLAGSFSEENCREYSRDYQAICPRIRYAIAHPATHTQFDYRFASETDMDRDPVYHWFGQHGLRYYIGSPLVFSPHYFAFMSLQRTKRQGHAQAQDVRLFELLKPHLSRAAALADQLGTLRSFASFSAAVLESLPQAVFALDDCGVIRFANSRADALLAAGDGIHSDSGQLKASLPANQAQLDFVIAAAAQPTHLSSGGWIRLQRPSGKTPLAVFVAPLSDPTDALQGTCCSVLVIVHDMAENRSVAIGMLHELYGLTATESRLASALTAGHSIESAAAFLQMQVATARSHLKSIFAKVGVHRQQDLVRILTAISGLRA